MIKHCFLIFGNNVWTTGYLSLWYHSRLKWIFCSLTCKIKYYHSGSYFSDFFFWLSLLSHSLDIFNWNWPIPHTTSLLNKYSQFLMFSKTSLQIKLGTVDQAEAQIEWVIRPYMNTTKKRKFLSNWCKHCYEFWARISPTVLPRTCSLWGWQTN